MYYVIVGVRVIRYPNWKPDNISGRKSDETQMDDNRSKIGQNWMKQKPVLDETQMQTLFFYYLIRLDQPQAYVLLII